jgi:hypothetical protein
MKKKQEPFHVLKFFEKDSAVRVFVLLIDRLTVPGLVLALAGLVRVVLGFFT